MKRGRSAIVIGGLTCDFFETLKDVRLSRGHVPNLNLGPATEPSNTVAEGGNSLTNAFIGRSVVTFATTMALAGMVSNGAIRSSCSVESHVFPVLKDGVICRCSRTMVPASPALRLDRWKAHYASRITKH